MKLRFVEFNAFLGQCQGFSNGQRQMRKALERQGVSIVHESETELQHLSAHLYNRGCKKSFIMPTHEADEIHPVLIEKINEADEVIAICEHNKEVFVKNGVTKPIHVVPQGIDMNIFKYEEKIRGDCLNFLWIGQTSMRKGWDLVATAFGQAFGNMGDVRLYMKTNGKGSQEIIDINDNIVFDSRNLSLADMLDLYRDNHVFVYPSRGEATGLPAMEAMASGLIVLAPEIQGLKEFVNDSTAIPLEYGKIPINFGVDCQAPNVKISDLVKKMRYCYDHYNEIIPYSKEVREHIEQKCSVDNMAKKLCEIMF